MSIEANITALTSDFKALALPSVEALVVIAKQQKPMPDSLRSQAYKIDGCSAETWVRCQCDQGIISLEIESDSKIIKGILGLFVKAYNNVNCEEVLSHPPLFLKDLGIVQHLSPNRRLGIGNVWKTIESVAHQNRPK